MTPPTELPTSLRAHARGLHCLQTAARIIDAIKHATGHR